MTTLARISNEIAQAREALRADIQKLSAQQAATQRDFDSLWSVVQELRANQVSLAKVQRDLLTMAAGAWKATEAQLNQVLTALYPGGAVGFSYEITDPATGATQTFKGDFSMIQTRHTTRHVKLVPKDADGNITQVVNALGQTTRYTFDANGNELLIFTTTAEAVNEVFGRETAMPVNAGVVRVAVPGDYQGRMVEYLAVIEGLDVVDKIKGAKTKTILRGFFKDVPVEEVVIESVKVVK